MKGPRKNVRRAVFEVPVEQELDLHGLTIDQGLLELENFILLCVRFKVKSVRVIHGIGPEKGPSMRKAVRAFLSTRARPWLTGIEAEPHNPGSIIIYVASA